MSKPWNDINLPGLSSGKKEIAPANKFITGVEDSETSTEELEPEVRLISAQWQPGPKGFEHNEQCFVDVKAEYLKNTIRARIRGKLFGILDGEEIDLAQEVEGFIDSETMVARMDIKKLWFVNLDHYKTWLKDKNFPSKYLLKGISHSRGANEIDSPVLEMPAVKTTVVDYIEFPDVLFNHNSAVPRMDNDNLLISKMAAALTYIKDSTDKEAILYGHTDPSVDTDPNQKLSELRAGAVKALLDNDQKNFAQICNSKSKVEDFQSLLSVLTAKYGWACDPGKVDNEDGPKTRAALKNFQSSYNRKFKKSIGEDGIIGQQTWAAFFDVIRDLISRAVSKEIGEKDPVITYGEGGAGIHACGDMFVKDEISKKGRKSQKNKKVELVFKNPEDTIKDTPYCDSVTMNPIDSKSVDIPVEKDKAHIVRLLGLTFDSNKCFLLPYSLPGIRAIIEMHKSFENAEMLIVGHDGGDEELKGVDLACCRAEILGGYLTNDVDGWAKWFCVDKPEKIRWGTREVQLMLSCLPEGKMPFYLGNASGITDTKTKDAIKKFQNYCNSKLGGNLKVDGLAGPKTQKELLKAYMAIEDTTVSTNIVPVAHGCEGQFEDDLTLAGMQPDERVIEVFFFENKITPVPPKKTSLNGATEYFDWKEQVVESKNFEYHGIHIQVIDKKKMPVKNAKVFLEGPNKCQSITDDQGFAFFSGLVAGEYSVRAEKKGIEIESSKITYPTAKTLSRSVPSAAKK